jgi:LysR family transcriptional regulator, cys regulon transcriptional activator
MNLRLLKTLCKVVDCGLSISQAAEHMNRSQSALSRQIQEVENSLCIKVFERQRNRLLRLTEDGVQVVEIARRLLNEHQSLEMIGEDARNGQTGALVIGTTHTQARYSLPRVVRAFMNDHPKVNLSLRQGDPLQCHEMVSTGRASLAVCTEVPEGVLFIPCYRLNRSIITQRNHPLTSAGELTLKSVAKYPLIMYGEAFSGRHVVEQAFARQGLKPKVVISAVDADVSTAYVEFGLGIAILATIAFDPVRDAALAQLDARHIVPSSALGVVVPKTAYLRHYMVDFIMGFAPQSRHLPSSAFCLRAGRRLLPFRQKSDASFHSAFKTARSFRLRRLGIVRVTMMASIASRKARLIGLVTKTNASPQHQHGAAEILLNHGAEYKTKDEGRGLALKLGEDVTDEAEQGHEQDVDFAETEREHANAT